MLYHYKSLKTLIAITNQKIKFEYYKSILNKYII